MVDQTELIVWLTSGWFRGEQHGASRYNKQGCRCLVCKQANTRAKRLYRSRRTYSV